jgi:hypothetical protein
MPEAAELPNTFVFRYALCRYIYALTLLTPGHRVQIRKSEKLRNELVDMVFVACATYFDGILGNEPKVNDIYGQAMFMLKHVFVSRTVA